jgi:hypothetical protein
MLHGPEDKGIRLLTEKYVPTTIGQTLGGGAKSLEDKMTSWPMIGPHIKQRRREAFEGFNRAAFNDALEPIGGKAEGIGEEGVAKAQKAVSQAYTDALAGTTLMRDPAFDAAITTHIPNIRGIRRVGPEVADEIEKLVRESFDPATGTISGEAFQASLAELRQLKRSYRGDPLFGSRIGPELTKVENELTGLFERQVPDKAADFANANKAYRHVSILGDAVDNASAGADGIFTPAQLRAKSRANTKLYSGKNASARGDRPFYELDKAGRANLPSSIPDSGTGERLLLPAALGVLAGGGTIGAEAADDEKGINLTTPVINTLGASLLGRMPYSKMSQALVRKALSGPRSPTAQMLGDLGNKYLAPGVAALTRPLYSDALIDRTPNPKVPYVPAGVPEGAPPEAETPALPPGMHIDPATGQIVPDEAPTGMAYGGAVRRLAQKYACGGPVRRYG